MLIVYALIMLAAWGAGDMLRGALKARDVGRSRIAGPLISFALGFGVLGELLFLIGVAGPFYRPAVMWMLLIAGAALALYRMRDLVGRAHPARESEFEPLTLFESNVIVISAIYVVRWLWVLSGFTVGSDVFSHHYAHVKYMIQAGRFGHAAHLPLFRDHISNYNPALMHTLVVPAHMLADERASNLIHWTAQVMLLCALYVFARQLRSRAAGLLAVGIYLTVGLLGNFPLDVQDYTLMGVYLLMTLHCVFLCESTGKRGTLVLAGVLAGMMTATKYYGLVVLPFVSILLLVVVGEGVWTRLRSALTFAVIALLFFVPWALYSLGTMGNPFYPMMSSDLMPRIIEAVQPVHTLQDFVAPGDQGFLLPRMFEYVSYFIPFSGPDAVFALSGLFLLLIPVSLFYALRRRWGRAAEANLLFLFSATLFVAIFVMISRIAFPKWAFFPALTYAVSIAVLAQEWSRSSRALLLVVVAFMILVNYEYIGSPYIRAYGPHTSSQSERWDAVSRYLNRTLPAGVVIEGLQYLHNYYLRSDVTGIEEQPGIGVDWPAEESALRRARVQYVVTYPRTAEAAQEWYASLIRLWKQLSPDHPAIAFLEDLSRRVAVRDRQKSEFLVRAGVPVHRFADGTMLYRVTW